ncbi:LysR family transcriptional regulator [Sphingomonas nostoxanthinifaciens]|uniref:LysR family transcriptional regulator n=1 Tax=Sphingomonas nostoxanthinifaciens TaxID=2872652 RepID=UPI001CC20B03|nr:LysR family transcriptional regulator [Sphingomonas nostoxanthinifaciens]UAK25368.1 LysR family transcriptional regulator [Sphingomonas nostoxanthinifaciens]
MKRTHLPLNGLRVLDAAARYLSFTRAADELAVTPAAVGQQIRTLEDVLGVVLFRRTAKGLELTPEGAAGLDALRRGFLEMEEAVRAMQAQQSSRHLTIAAPRDFTAKWLGARLAAYGRTDPELAFALVASDDGLDFTQANLDLAVCFTGEKGEHEGVPIGPRAFVTVGAPDGSARPIGWPGCPGGESEPIATVADAGLAIDAAIAGLGRATVPVLLAEADLAAGRAVEFGRQEVERGYWLIAPVPQWRQKKVKSLVAALTQ